MNRMSLRTALACLMLAMMLPCPRSVADGLLLAQSNGWNWDAFEAIDDTPLDAKKVIVREDSATPRRSIDEVTAPDLDATPHRAYALFAGMPAVEVIPSRRDEQMHPCSNCHQSVTSNPDKRELQPPHDNFRLAHGLHGKGGFWCFTCHADDDVGRLKTLDNGTVAFEDAYIVCGQCHVRQARDWAYGAHGKRHDNWRGPRRIYNCTACHYQHAPALREREIMPGPSVRMGLARPSHWNSQAVERSVLHHPPQPWQHHAGTPAEQIHE